jgi:hypothetical protein
VNFFLLVAFLLTTVNQNSPTTERKVTQVRPQLLHEKLSRSQERRGRVIFLGSSSQRTYPTACFFLFSVEHILILDCWQKGTWPLFRF